MDPTEHCVQTIARHVGMVMQEPEAQIIGRTLFEDVAFGLRNYLFSKEEIELRASEALSLVGLKGLENRKCDRLSGGEKQRLAIAGVLAVKPKVLVLDEPASELDPTGRRSIYHLLSELRTRKGLTIVLVERQTNDLTNHIDRIAVLARGRIVRIDAFRQQDESRRERKQTARFSTWAAQVNRRPSYDSFAKGAVHPQPLLEIRDLNFGYDTESTVLHGIDLTIHAGDFLAWSGHNGAGKTSLVKHLNGLIEPPRNSIFLEGRDIVTINRKKLIRSVGLVFQNPDHQLFESTVEREIAFGPKNLGLKKKETKEMVEQILRETGLTEVRGNHPYALPRGIRQIVAIASIVVLRPRLLIIDEPTTGLDAQGVERVMGLCDRLHAAGTTIVLISHDLDLIRQYSNRIVVLKKGRIATDSAVSATYRHSVCGNLS